MAKVIMTCGTICCGKSTYAKKIQAEQNAARNAFEKMVK